MTGIAGFAQSSESAPSRVPSPAHRIIARTGRPFLWIRVTPGGQEVVLVISVRPHPRFQQKEADLYTEVTVPLFDALLGSETAVPTLKGRVLLTLPRATQNGRTFRLAGQGMPRLGESTAKGDLYVTVKVALPSNLSDEEIDELATQFK